MARWWITQFVKNNMHLCVLGQRRKKLCSQNAVYVALLAAKRFSVRWSVLHPSWWLCNAVVCAARSAVIIKDSLPSSPRVPTVSCNNWENTSLHYLPSTSDVVEENNVESCHKALDSTSTQIWIMIIIHPHLMQGRSTGYWVCNHLTNPYYLENLLSWIGGFFTVQNEVCFLLLWNIYSKH